MSILIATQSLSLGGHGSSPLLRNCVDMAILYHSSFISTQKSIYIGFGGWLPSFKDFLAICTKTTKEKGKHYALVCQTGAEDLASSYSNWRAPLVKPFEVKWQTWAKINKTVYFKNCILFFRFLKKNDVHLVSP